MKRLILVLSVLLLAMLVSPVLAVTDLTEVGFLPLNSFRNIIWNDTMFIEQGNTIRAYNVSPSLLADITAADVAGEVIFSYPVKGMYLDRNDSILYVSTVTSLSTVDVSDPLNPVLLGTALKWMGNGNMGQGIFAQDGFAYVGGTTQIFVFDVSNPSNPMYLTSKYYPYAETICVDVLVSDGTYLYGGYNPEGGTNTAWVSIWDISTPGTVTHYKTFQANPGGGGGYGDVTGLAYRNNTLYVTVYGSRMTTWDITNKSAPVIFSGWTKWDLYVNTVIVDNYLFGSIRYLGIYGNKAIQIWDISNNSPVDMGYSGPSLGYSNGIGSNGNLTAICRQNGGIYLFNTTDKTYAGMQKSSAKIKNLNIPGESWGAEGTTIGNIDVLEVCQRNIQSVYYNITDPYDWQTLGFAPLGSYSPGNGNPREYAINAVNNYSFTTGGGNQGYPGLYVADLTNISQSGFDQQPPPHQEWGGQYIANYADNKYLFLMDVNNWFELYNNSNPLTGYVYNPVYGTYTPPLLNRTQYFWDANQGDPMRSYNSSDPNNNYYVGLADSSLTIYNLSDPTKPTRTKTKAGSCYMAVMAYDPIHKFAYIYDCQHNIRQVDLSNLSDIANITYRSEKAYVDGTDSICTETALAVNGTDVFAVGKQCPHQIQRWSFADRTHPLLLNSSSTVEGDASGVTYYKGYVYMVGANTIYAFEVDPVATPTLPVVAFTADKWSGTEPLTVQFTDQSESGVTWDWDWDDGTSHSLIKNPLHTFQTDGTYHVNLTIYSAALNQYNSTTHTVTVTASDLPVADFTANTTYSLSPPLTVAFTSLETNGVSYSWNVTDGGSGVDATTRNYTHTYTDAGVYTVNYTVVGAGSDVSTMKRTDYITIGGTTCNETMILYADTAADGALGRWVTAGEGWSTITTGAGNQLDWNNAGAVEAAVENTHTTSNKWDNAKKFGWSGDTSPIPDSSTINSILMSFYAGTGGAHTLHASPSIVLMRFTPADPAVISMTDFNRKGSYLNASNITYATWNAGGRMNFTIPSTDFDIVNKTGYTSVAILTATDAFGTSYWASDLWDMFQVYDTSYTGTTRDPFMQIAYNYTCAGEVTPIANFSVNKTFGDVPLTVQFTDTSQNNPTSWNWSINGTWYNYTSGCIYL